MRKERTWNVSPSSWCFQRRSRTGPRRALRKEIAAAAAVAAANCLQFAMKSLPWRPKRRRRWLLIFFPERNQPTLIQRLSSSTTSKISITTTLFRHLIGKDFIQPSERGKFRAVYFCCLNGVVKSSKMFVMHMFSYAFIYWRKHTSLSLFFSFPLPLCVQNKYFGNRKYVNISFPGSAATCLEYIKMLLEAAYP